MDHHMNGKFTSEAPTFLLYLSVFAYCILVVLSFSFHLLCSLSVRLGVVMECREFIIRAARVTTMSWYVFPVALACLL